MNEIVEEPQAVAINELLKQQPILLFDGECGFCNHSIQFFLRRENTSKRMHFAPLESPAGKALRAYFKISANVDSIILIRNHDAFVKSCAALRLTQYMKGLWPLLSIFVIIAPFLRNMVYDLIARNRKRLAGRVENCALLSSEERERFLDR